MDDIRKRFCPVCGNELEINGTLAQCKCGYAAEIKQPVARPIDTYKKAGKEEVERLLAESDELYNSKNYEEAFMSYGTVLDVDGGCIRAMFRRELTSQYLMMGSSSVYLNSDSFFTKMKDIKERVSEKNDETLSLSICRDMIDYFSARADYEKKYASLHKNEKTAAAYLSDTLLIFEYTAETVKYLNEKPGVEDAVGIARLISDGCAVAMKLRGMLLSGAEYVSTPEKLSEFSKENAARNVSRIKRLRLSQEEEIELETLAGNMRQIKNALISSAPEEIYKELKAADDKAEAAAHISNAEDDSKRIEYEMWRTKNEKDYSAADRKIVLFGALKKGSLVIFIIVLVIFALELVLIREVIVPFVIIAAVFIGLYILFGALRNKAKEKKEFYAKVIESDSVNLRTRGKDFRG